MINKPLSIKASVNKKTVTYNGGVVKMSRFKSAVEFADYFVDQYESSYRWDADFTNTSRQDLILIYNYCMEA